MSSRAYTVSPDNQIFAVRPRVVDWRKTSRGWIHDPHVDGWELASIPLLKAPGLHPIDGELMGALTNGLPFVDWKDVHARQYGRI